MAKKRATLSGRGAEILFGTQTPPTPEPVAGESPGAEAFESNQQGEYIEGTGAEPLSSDTANVLAQPSMRTVAPIEVSPDNPPPRPPILPSGTVVDVSAGTTQPPTAVSPMRTYDFPPPAEQENVQASLPRLNAIPRPSLTASSTISTLTSSTGGNVSNPSSTPPPRGTSVVSPTTPTSTAPQAMPSPPGNGSSTQPTPTPSAPTSTSGGNGRPMTMPSIPTPPPMSAPGAGMTSATPSLPVSDILRVAAQLNAERAAAEEAAQKAKEQFKVDEATVKALRERLFKEIGELYQLTCDTVCDSPQVANFAFDLLKKARLNLLSSNTAGDLSEAEFFIERVRSKISRSRDPIPADQRKNLWGIVIFQVITLAISTVLISLPWLPDGTTILSYRFGTDATTKVFLALLAALGWGGIGGVIGTLYNLPWFVQMREYDPAYNLTYVAGPIKGFVVGGVIFLFISAGIISSNTSGDVNKFLFAYVVSFLFGFKQEYVFQLFDDLLKVILRAPPDKPKQIDPDRVA